ncbi:MAG: MATE family efflux transporter [Prevotella sp.]|nr:MATE family efflux transporter [Prevotella sp.]
MKTIDRDILRLAIPSIVQNVTVPLLGLVDLAIVGHIGDATYIGAIAVGSMIFNVMYWLLGFLRMGTSGLTAQAVGRNDQQGIHTMLSHSLTLGLLFGLMIVVLQIPLRGLSIWLMGPSEEIATLVRTYFNICIWGAPATLSLYALTGWFIGMQDTHTPMAVSILQNIINIACSLLFVYGLGMRIEGVALGTLVAQWSGLAMALWALERKGIQRPLSVGFSFKSKNKTDGFAPFLRVNRDIFLRTVCLVAVNLFFTAAGARQGDLILSVNTLLMTLFTLFSYVMDGFAFAGEAMGGKLYGARDVSGFQALVRRLFLWGAIMVVLFTATYALGGKPFLSLLTNHREVIEAATPYLPWALLIPLAGVAAFIYDGIFIGITATRGMLLSSVIATAVFFILHYTLSPSLHNHALWLALIVYLVLRGVIQAIWLRRKV